MNIHEKRKAFEKLLAGAPEVMSPLQVSKWTPYGRNTVYAMLRSGELPSIQYRRRIKKDRTRSECDRKKEKPKLHTLCST